MARPCPPRLPSRETRRWARPLLTVALALCSVVAPPAWSSNEQDHERARRAVLEGKVLALPGVLARVAREYPGQVLEVELEQDDGLWLYEIKLLQADGRLVKLKLDARSGAVMHLKAR